MCQKYIKTLQFCMHIMLYIIVLGITTHLCLFFRKEIKYSFMHFCHLLTNIPETGRRNGSFHFILARKNNENYIHVLCNVYYPHCSLKHIIFCFTHLTLIELKLTLELYFVLLMQILKIFHQKF